MTAASKQIAQFQKTILDFYKKNKRELPWRKTKDPYRIFVSEVMLQQTQVQSVLKKYGPFIKAFPNFSSLSNQRFQLRHPFLRLLVSYPTQAQMESI